MKRIDISTILIMVVMVTLQSSWVFSGEGEGFTYNDNGKRDPFWNLVGPGGSIHNYESDLMISDLSLQGIMSGAAGNIAMINGKIVKVKDKVGQFVITEITDNWVVLEKNQQIFKLKLKKEE